MPEVAKASRSSRSARPKGLPSTGSLNLDELPAARHDDVEVDLRAGVLFVTEVQARGALDDANAYGCHAIGEQVVGNKTGSRQTT